MGEHRRQRNRPITHAAIYPRLVTTAKRHGYALALHGSMSRDMDIVAVPWVSEASTAKDLIDALAKKVGGWNAGAPSKMPHGRLGFVVHIPAVFFNDRKPFYLDVGVMHLHRSK